MRQDIQQLVGRVAQKEPAHASGLVGQFKDDGNPLVPGPAIDRVDVIDLDRRFIATSRSKSA